MTAEHTLRQVTDLLEAAKRQAEEKRKHFQSARAIAQQPGGYEAYLVAAHQYAAAADRVEELTDGFTDALADAQAEDLRRERELQPQFDGLPLDEEMNRRALDGDEEARQWVYRNLK